MTELVERTFGSNSALLVAAARDAVKKEALRKAGIGYHEVMAGHTTPGDLRTLVEKLMPEHSSMGVAEDRRALKTEILRRPANELVGELVIDRLPRIFGNLASYRVWREAIALDLDVDACDVYVVGSAVCGFSLSPWKNFRSFRRDSDVDVAIVSAHHFDLAWRALRKIGRNDVPADVWRSVRTHQTNYIYWGCIASDYLLPLLPYGVQWLEAAVAAGNRRPTLGRDIRFRIYRDASSLRDYTVFGLDGLKGKLIEEKYDPEIS